MAKYFRATGANGQAVVEGELGLAEEGRLPKARKPRGGAGRKRRPRATDAGHLSRSETATLSGLVAGSESATDSGLVSRSETATSAAVGDAGVEPEHVEVEVRAEPKCPSSRDQMIYFQVRIEGRNQWEVGDMYELSQARISQICRDVARWHAAQGVEPPEELAARRKRLADFDEYQRLKKLYEDTLRELDRTRSPEVERKLGRRGHVEWDEMSYRPPKGRVQLLKLIRCLIHDLHEAEQRVRGLLEEEREEAGDGSQETGDRSQETGEGEAPPEPNIYTGDGPISDSHVRADAPAEAAEGANEGAAEACGDENERAVDEEGPVAARKNGVSINGYCDGPKRHRFDYGISENLMPITRVIFRGLRAEAEVQDAMDG